MNEIAKASWENVARAAGIIRSGGLVAFGTETVYGLGADATNRPAVTRIYSAKGRPSNNPLIVHYARSHEPDRDVVMNGLAWELADKFWPGPLTLILPKRHNSRVVEIAGAGLPTLAVRVPRLTGPNMIELAETPVVAPSANRSGRISPTSADHVLAELNGSVDLILDSGACGIGVESTVVDLSGQRPKLLRYGGLDPRELTKVLGTLSLEDSDDDAPTSPGQMRSHYAPNCVVVLNQAQALDNFAHLAFGDDLLPSDTLQHLSFSGDLEEAAASLFSRLRALDAIVAEKGLRGIAVSPIPETGLGLAINDRLRRASADRSTINA